MTFVKSEIDNLEYKVRNLNDKTAAANTLSVIRSNLMRLVNYLEEKYPEKENVELLVKRFNPNNISEGTSDKTQTSLTVDKGKQIIFCLRSRKAETENQIHNINILMYVAIHELAHIMSKSTHHTPEFMDNFFFLLKEASKIGIYNTEILEGGKQEYCGLEID
jgi:hypothetical protein